MDYKEILKDIVDKKDIKPANMAAALNLSQQTLWDRLNSKSIKGITITKLNEMLLYLGYDLVIMPRGKAGRIEGAYVVDNTAKPKEKKAPEKVAEKEMTEKAE